MVSDLLEEKEELLKQAEHLKLRIADLEKEVIVWKKASENNSYRALLSEDKYNKQKEINQELVEENESLKDLLKKLKPYRCKNQYKEELNYSKTHCLFHSDCPTQKELADIKLKVEALEGQTPWKDIKDKSEVIRKLTKAKEIIKGLLNSCFGYNSKTVNYEVKTKAEQFLKENEVEE